jgi:hypothetical protein
MIDIAVSREAYNRQDLSDIGLVRSEFNPADAFTKAGNCQILDAILRTGRLDHPVVQCVIRQGALILLAPALLNLLHRTCEDK